ncbi:MAG: UvrD-helicase domain-containing protein [Anaerolineae bacterium]
MANFTPQQEQAITTHNKNLIVVAGAGSGKTRVLVERYLDLLATHPDWRLNQLVAITFTREAAYEMRNRVRQSLEQRAQTTSDDTQRQHWVGLLGQIDSARIDTIHSMCATILRANAAEAHLDSGFSVLEPVEAGAMLADIIDAQLQVLGDHDPDDIVPLFAQYDLYMIRELLANQALLAVNLSDAPIDTDALVAQWRDQWEKLYREDVQRLITDIDVALNWAHEIGIPDGDKLADIYRTVEQLREALGVSDLSQSKGAYKAIIETIKLTVGSASNWGDKEIVKTAKDYLKTVRENAKDYLDAIGDFEEAREQTVAQTLIRWYRLLKRVQDDYYAEKLRLSYLDFNDLETYTAHLLAEHPSVRQRYQNAEFKHLLVDEFQDTNALQWEIVRHLADGDQHGGALFVVGDPKQSIYAFRGADVSVFEHVRQTIAHHRNGQELDLTVSFRSHPGLIDQFNQLFATILQRDENSPVASYQITLGQPMSAFRQQLPDPNAQHYAPFEFILQTDSTQEPIDSDKRRSWEAHEIGKRLQQLRADGAMIHDKDGAEGQVHRSFDYGDVAILFQSTTHITRYEQVFKALGIPFVTIAGRGYYNRQEVWDVLNLLKALHHPADNLALASALRSPMFAFNDELLLALRLLRDESNQRLPLWQALSAGDVPYISAEQQAQQVRARDVLHDLRRLSGRVTIAELLRVALAKTGYLAMLTGLPDGARLRRNVEKLVDIAEQSGKITLGAFAHYLDDLTAKEVREGEALLDTSGAVRLMTVHASKGLEFPVVVLADASWQNRGGNRDPLIYDSQTGELACKVYDEDEGKHVPSFTYSRADYLQGQREEAERKRLLYVACTRARDCLIISGHIRQKKDGDWSVSGWLSELLKALEIDDFDNIGDGETLHNYATPIRFHRPAYNEELMRGVLSNTGQRPWRELAVTEPALASPLTQTVQIAPEQWLGHIAATQLADLGSYRYADLHERPYYRDAVRRAVLDDSAPQIREALRTQDPRVRPRQLGEVVHEALRYWRFPDQDEQIDEILRSYAWQQNITDADQLQDVVRRARRMLATFQTSTLYQAMAQARAGGAHYYTELPFIYRTDKRIIHGVIDALFQHEGAWWLVDYKTGTVRGGASAIEQHAHRYYLQVGTYASAIRQELQGKTPRVFVHYIQYNHTVEVPTSAWEAELQQLDAYIGDLIGQV